VTNSLGFLPEVDEIFMLDNGEVVEMGSYDALIEKNDHFAQFVHNFVSGNNKDSDEDDVKKDENKET
jgi:hypothetical protein